MNCCRAATLSASTLTPCPSSSAEIEAERSRQDSKHLPFSSCKSILSPTLWGAISKIVRSRSQGRPNTTPLVAHDPPRTWQALTLFYVSGVHELECEPPYSLLGPPGSPELHVCNVSVHSWRHGRCRFVPLSLLARPGHHERARQASWGQGGRRCARVSCALHHLFDSEGFDSDAYNLELVVGWCGLAAATERAERPPGILALHDLAANSRHTRRERKRRWSCSRDSPPALRSPALQIRHLRQLPVTRQCAASYARGAWQCKLHAQCAGNVVQNTSTARERNLPSPHSPHVSPHARGRHKV